MRTKTLLVVLIALATLSLAVVSCGGGGGGGGAAPPTLVSIAVTPSNAGVVRSAIQQFTATGTYSNSSTQNITASVTWNSATTSVATISAAGLSTPVSAGTTTITATSGSIIGSTIMTVQGVNLPSTGQIVSYGTGSVGDDGALQKGVVWPNPRFTPVSSGTGTVVTDNLTGLMWDGDGSTPTFATVCTGGTKTWQGSLDYVACLNTNTYLGYTDWRLPNIHELRSLINYGTSANHTLLNGQGYTSVQAAAYWSSTSTFAGNNQTASAWGILMTLGSMLNGSKSSSSYSWPVRGGAPSDEPAQVPMTGQKTSFSLTTAPDDGDLQAGVVWPNPRFTAVSSGTGTRVTDNLTGLVWTGDASTPTVATLCTGGTMTWQQAIDYVACLNANTYLGYTDWRLPNINELESVIDLTALDNAVTLNSQGVTSAQALPYWTSTTSAAASGQAWYVDMYDGTSSRFTKTLTYHVWPVRGGQ